MYVLCKGIGYQIVLDLAQRGCRVIIADVAEDKNLLENIFNETHSRNIIFKYTDLASFDSVRELANFVIGTEGKLDILINNAGVGNIAETTTDGLDKVTQVNYFSAFLLTHLVADLLKEAKGRILFTSSVLSHFHNFSLKKLHIDGTSNLDKFFCYNNAKLCNIMAADMFAVKLKKYGVTCNSYNPGAACTNIFLGNIRNRNSIFYDVPSHIFNYIICFIGKTAEEAAQTAIYLACANEVKNVSGEYFFALKPTFKPRLLRDTKICQAVWQATEELVKLKPHEKL